MPHTLVSWRFLLPKQSWKVQLHRRVWLSAFPQFPRLMWFGIFIYSSVTWLLWYGWKHIILSFKRNHEFTFENYKISPLKQLTGLFSATFLHAIPASAYYQFKLFNHKERDWLDYIYNHELPHWHNVLSSNISKKTLRILTNKAYFSEVFSKVGLATVPTLKIFKKNSVVSEGDIFTERSCFIKPTVGSRSEHCILLQFNKESGLYRLEGDEINQSINNKTEILKFIIQLVKQREMIMQPLLLNHPLIQKYNPTNTLVTLRLITAYLDNRKPEVVSALLEITVPNYNNSWWLIAIDCRQGMTEGHFIDSSGNWFKSQDSFKEKMKGMAGETMPFWNEIVNLCCEAHKNCEGILTVGWDVVITPEGVKLLEGNNNWATGQHQMAYGSAMLKRIVRPLN